MKLEQRNNLVSVNKNWTGKLIRNNSGTIKKILANAITAFRFVAEWQGVIGYDCFSNKTMMRKPAPWEKPSIFRSRVWTSNDDCLANEWLQRNRIEVSLDITRHAIETVSYENTFNPLQEFLNSLTWDGVSRIENWLTNFMGANDSVYTKEVGKRFLISAMARAFKPGCKVDCVLVLEGAQGAGKSQAARILAGAEYFADELSNLGSKDSALQLQGKWIIEISEMAATSRSEIEEIKAFITRQVDNIRPPYGRRTESFPRQCIFIGTVNNINGYLKDPTGARRFWPVECKEIDLAGLKLAREQLLAEALHHFRNGDKWWIEDKAILEQAIQEQQDRYQHDPWDVTIAGYVGDKNQVTINDILVYLNIEKGKQTQADSNRISRSLVSLGFTKKRLTDNGERYYAYTKLS